MSEDEELDSDPEIFSHQTVAKGRSMGGGSQDGEEAWRNSEGERLKDFGVDEEVEFYDEQEEDEEDDVPLSELLARRRAAKKADEGEEKGMYT